MRVKARPGIGKMERIFGYIWLQQCECMWICLSECIEILNVFCTLILFVCRLDQISSLQIDLTQPKRWSIFSKRSNELVICAKILVSEVSGNSLWSHLSLQLHISLHLPVYLTAHPPRLGMRAKILWSNLMSLEKKALAQNDPWATSMRMD